MLLNFDERWYVFDTNAGSLSISQKNLACLSLVLLITLYSDWV